MRGLADEMRELGVPIEPLMAQLQIPLAALTEEELRISLQAYVQLLEIVSQRANCPDLGLRLAARQDITILGPLAIAMQHAETVGDALAVCARYLHTHSPGIRVSVHRDSPTAGETCLRMAFITPGWLPRRQAVEQSLADLFNFSSWIAQDRLPALRVSLPHAQLAATQRYVETFGRPAEFMAPHAEIVVPSEFLDRGLTQASATLHQMSLDYLQLAFLPGEQTVGERVEEVLRRALASTRGRRDIVAKLLDLHPRTLQRRLAAEGLRYQAILDTARREQAIHWLTESEVPLSQIAGMLGLADQAVLTRNCQRWFGRSPARVRAIGPY